MIEFRGVELEADKEGNEPCYLNRLKFQMVARKAIVSMVFHEGIEPRLITLYKIGQP